jgi:CRP-like cAMP-binding protein
LLYSRAVEAFPASDAPRTVNVLRADRDLLDAVPPARREAAGRAARAEVVEVEAGRWDAKDEGARSAGGHGLLVLEGLLVRRVGFGDRVGAELLGPGDLLRPLEHDGEEATLPFEATWRVVVRLRLAALDRRWSYRVAPVPEIGIALTAKAMLRSRRLANTLAISQNPKLDARLHLLFWELADRFGRVRADGVHLDLPLTHELLSHLASARRPSVSSALGRLCEAGLLERHGSGWLLHGEPPGPETWRAARSSAA